MKKYILIITTVLFLALILGHLNAQETPPVDLYKNNPELIKQTFVNSLDRIPNNVLSFLNNETIKLVINRYDDSQIKLSGVIKNNEISDVSFDDFDSYSVIITTSEDVINTIYQSSDFEHIAMAFNDGRIKIETFSFWSSVKFGLAKTVLRIYGWFS